MHYTCYSQASSPLHRADDKVVCGWDSLLRKTWEPPRPKAELQGESSAGMLTASVGLMRHPALSCQQVEGIKKTGSRVASALGHQDQGWCPLVLQLEGKVRQACLNCMRPWALSITGRFCSCYANLKQLILLLVSWAPHSFINFKREWKRMTLNICFWLSD